MGIFLSSRGYAEEPESILFFKDGKTTRIPAPPRAEIEQYRDETRFTSEELYKESQKAHDEFRKSQGLPPRPVFTYPEKEKRDPNEVVKFELPPDQILSGCVYAASSTFPDICYEKHVGSPADTSKIIFRAGKDPQSVLDAIKESQGVTGEYNVMPEGYTADWTLWEKYQKGLPLKDETATDNTAEVGKTQEEKR